MHSQGQFVKIQDKGQDGCLQTVAWRGCHRYTGLLNGHTIMTLHACQSRLCCS